ncbi:MAG TPA: glutathione ABC transporter substrate-binding protein [Thermotogota bacterium]|nr:glutathione ABC transporter substrate-binding protein [Thermotogota bacterium]
MLKAKAGVVVFVFLCSALLGFGANMGGDFVFLLGTDAVSLLPANQNDSHSEMVSRHICEGLVEFSPRMEIVPCLAKSWEVSESGRVYTFSLQEGIRFHDGSPFNAQAVKTYFDFMLAGKMRRSSFLQPYIKQVEVVSEYVVRFQLHFPFGAFLHYLAHTASLIVSPLSIDNYRDDIGKLGRNPVGTGPFVFGSWDTGEKISLKANLDYWKGRPSLDSILFRIVPEDITRVMQVQSGDANLTTNVPPVMYSLLTNDPNLTVRVEPTLRVIYLGLDNNKPPFDDTRVRQAINYALDKEMLVEVILQGMADACDSFLSPLTKGYSPVGQYPHDPQKARELLEQAGYPDGFSAKLVTPKGRYPQDYETAIAIQGMLEEVGIHVDVEYLEWARYTAVVFSEPEEAAYDMFLHGWAPSTGEVGWVLRPLFQSTNLPPSGDNATHFDNPELDDLIQRGMRAVDPVESQQIYTQAQRLIFEQAPWGFLYYLKQVVVYDKNVQGVEVLPIDIVLVKNAWFE